MRGRVVKFHTRSLTIVNSTALTSSIFIGQLKQKASESCQKDVNKLSKLITLSSSNGIARSTVIYMYKIPVYLQTCLRISLKFNGKSPPSEQVSFAF